MKKIINPWRNHEGYNCFGCSPNNPIGLHLEFYEDGDYIVSTWHPEHNYQGWVDTMHGGILSMRLGGHPQVTDQRLYRAVECEVPQGCPNDRTRIDHQGQSLETATESGIYQCGDHQLEG